MPTGRSGCSPVPSRWCCCWRSPTWRRSCWCARPHASTSCPCAPRSVQDGAGSHDWSSPSASRSPASPASPAWVSPSSPSRPSGWWPPACHASARSRSTRAAKASPPPPHSLPAGRYSTPADVKTFWRRVEARAAEADGVTAAGLAGSLPPDNFGDVNNFDLLDKPVPAGTAQHLAPWSAVSPGFFAAMGIPLLDGRLITPGDSATAPPVVVVSRAWAATYYPNESPIGKQLYSGGCTSCPPTTVIGVVGDVPYRGLAGGARAGFAPAGAESQDVDLSLNLVVRSRIGAAATFRALRSALGALDPQVAAVEVVMSERLRAALGDPRRWTVVVGAFAAAGGLLAALGIFGLMSYVVRQRRRALGGRLALAAAPGSLTRLVVGRGLRYAGFGSALGLVLSALAPPGLGSL